MSNGIQTGQILIDLQAAIVAAWSPTPTDPTAFPVSWEDPRLPIGGATANVSAPFGYATILAEQIEISLSGIAASVGMVNQQNEFQVIGRFPWPSDPSSLIVTNQLAKANALIAQLQTGPNFGTGAYGILPLVSRVDLSEMGDKNERMYTVGLTFTVITRTTHH